MLAVDLFVELQGVGRDWAPKFKVRAAVEGEPAGEPAEVTFAGGRALSKPIPAVLQDGDNPVVVTVDGDQ